MLPLCTNCNHPVKPVVALDIDGTMAMYHEHFLMFATGYFNQDTTREFCNSYPGTMSLADYLGITKEEYRQCKLAFRQGGLKRTMPPLGAPNTLTSTLRMMECEIWVTTTRPYQRLDNVDPDTREWLARNEVLYDGLIYDEDKYARLIDIVGKERIVAVLEDEPEQYEAARALGLPVYLLWRPHNRHANIPSMPDQASAMRAIAAEVKSWRMQHG